MPPAWAQAAGFVAFGYALRTATLIKDADVQVRIACVSAAVRNT